MQALEIDPSSHCAEERWLSPLKHYSVTSQQLLQKPVPETQVGLKKEWLVVEGVRSHHYKSVHQWKAMLLFSWLILPWILQLKCGAAICNKGQQFILVLSTHYCATSPVTWKNYCGTFLRISTLSPLVLAKLWEYSPENSSHWGRFLLLHLREHLFNLNTMVATLR